MRSFEPVPSQSGRAQLLAGDVEFAGVETDSGFVERGILTLPFELDGSSEAASIFLARPDGEEQILELEPLIEAVWVHAD